MGMDEMVSVIIPTYNVEDFIERSVRSIADQTHQITELILVDDGSRDDTPARIRALQEKIELPIRSYFLEKNRGASHARNIGLQEARGKYVQFLDADDELRPEKIEGQLEFARKEEADLVVGNFKVRNEEGEEVRFHWDPNPWSGLLRTRLGNTCANLWKKSFLEEVGGWNEGMKSSQEYELLFRILKAGAILAFDKRYTTLVHRRKEGSISNSRGELDKWKQYVDLRMEVLDHLKAQSMGDMTPYYQAALNALQNLAAIDPKEAEHHFQKHFPRGFIPQKDLMNPWWYRFLFRYLGFERAEKFRNRLRRA